MPLGDLAAKWHAFGWDVIELENGNQLEEVMQILESAKKRSGQGKPVMILLRTEMGAGVDFMMGTNKFHGVPPNDEQLENALGQLEETLGDY